MERDERASGDDWKRHGTELSGVATSDGSGVFAGAKGEGYRRRSTNSSPNLIQAHPRTSATLLSSPRRFDCYRDLSRESFKSTTESKCSLRWPDLIEHVNDYPLLESRSAGDEARHRLAASQHLHVILQCEQSVTVISPGRVADWPQLRRSFEWFETSAMLAGSEDAAFCQYQDGCEVTAVVIVTELPHRNQNRRPEVRHSKAVRSSLRDLVVESFWRLMGIIGE